MSLGVGGAGGGVVTDSRSDGNGQRSDQNLIPFFSIFASHLASTLALSDSFHSAADETMESPTLTQLNAEIAGIDADIHLERAKLETAEGEKAADLRTSIKSLNARLEARSTTRDALALLLAGAPAPSKNTRSF